MSWSSIVSTPTKETTPIPMLEKQKKRRTAKEIVSSNIAALEFAKTKYTDIENKSKNLSKTEENDIHNSMQRRHASYDESDNFFYATYMNE
jgi:hypothetical protein